jgi:hypothetical protein
MRAAPLKIGAMTWLLIAAAALASQDDPAALKKKLMDQVRARLAEERAQILSRIGTLLDEELEASGGGAAGLAEQIDQRAARIKKEIDDRQFELRALALMKADLPIVESLPKEGPKTGEDMSRIFQEAYGALSEEKDYAKGNRGFKVLYYALKDQEDTRLSFQATISAYNIACGYSLMGKEHAETALDWLELSLRRGYAERAAGCRNGCQYDTDPHSSFEHMEIDPDLENLRDTERWKELTRRFKPTAERPK